MSAKQGRCEVPDNVKSAVFQHFKERFSEQNQCRPTLDGIQFNSLDQGQRESLVARFSEGKSSLQFGLVMVIKAQARMG